MQRIKNSTAVSVLPTYVGNSADPGYFADQNVGLGQEGTVVDAAFLNGVQEELITVIESVDLVPSPSDNSQLLQALQAGFGLPHGAGSGGFGYWITLPGGFIVQMKEYAINLTGGVDASIAYPVAFSESAFAVLLQRRDYINEQLQAATSIANNKTHFVVRSPATGEQTFQMLAFGK